jgi:hypothetical protein
MKKPFFPILSIFLFFLSISAQDKYGLVLDNNKILQSKDTLSLSYPSSSTFIFCELFDANTILLGQIPVEWSMTGNLTVIDTPIVSQKIIINASRALTDQRGYISATALEYGAQWINNKVYVKIKGKNSGVLRGILVPVTPNHDFKKFDIAGRVQITEMLCPSGVFLMREALEKNPKKVMIIK